MTSLPSGVWMVGSTFWRLIKGPPIGRILLVVILVIFGLFIWYAASQFSN